MTDISSEPRSVHNRLGVVASLEEGTLTLTLEPTPEVTHHGIVRASVLSYMIDVAGGVPLDVDDNVWTFTTDLTVRMRLVPAPLSITARSATVRQGRRSSTCLVELTTDSGSSIGVGAIGFATIPRKVTDPPKPKFTPEVLARLMVGDGSLSQPLRDEAGIEVVDANEGIVQVDVTPQLRNPAGTLQGAMVALVAEAAAEEVMAARFESSVVVTDLDLRYLARTAAGPVRTRCRLLGTEPDSSIQVELIDTSTDVLTTLAYARVAFVT